MLAARVAVLAVLITALAVPVIAAESVPLIPRQSFFGNPTKAGAEMSHDGKRIAFLAPVDGVLNVWVAPVGKIDEAKPVTHDTSRGIHGYFWAYDGRHLVYSQDKAGDENWHVYEVDLETGATTDLTPIEGVRATIDGVSRKAPGEILITLNKRDPRYPDLYRVNLETGATTLVIENPGYARFVTDDDYAVRFAVNPKPDGSKELLRKDQDGKWTPWITLSEEDARTSGWGAIESTGMTMLMRDSRGRDTAALTALDLQSGAETVLAEDKRADIGGVLADIDTHKPQAYTVMVERVEYKALDPKIQPDLDFIAKADIGDWGISSRTEDDRYWVVNGFSDLHPGRAYVYDRKARTLTKLFDTRPELADAPLVAMHPVTLKSRDGLSLVSYLSLPKGSDTQKAGQPDTPLPMVLLVHGGPWGRDGFGYNALHQWLANRGYAVLSVNFRASAGFGKSFLHAGDLEWGRKMDDDLLDAVAWAVKGRIADPKRIAIMGGSYGGYATLVGLTRDPDTYACGIEEFGPSNLASLMTKIPAYWAPQRAELFHGVGDPGTEAGQALLKERSPMFQAERISKPLLIGQGTNDVRVDRSESDGMVAAMKDRNIPVAYMIYPDEGHGFARPPNNLSFLAVAEQFLAKCLGGRAQPITVADLKGSSLQVVEGGDQVDGLMAAMKDRDAAKPADPPAQ